MFRIHLLAPAVALSGLALALLFSAVSAGDKDAATTDAAAKPAVPAAEWLVEASTRILMPRSPSAATPSAKSTFAVLTSRCT